MFQYTFLRTHAARIGVGFYCPPWDGDRLFELRDESLRQSQPFGLTGRFHQASHAPGYDPAALKIVDATEMEGYFQSWRYVQHTQAQEWFRFRPEAVQNGIRTLAQHRHRPLAAVHVRMGDYLGEYHDRYYVARRSFYARAIAPVASTHRVLVFSDDPARARQHVGGLWPDTVFVTGLSAGDDLYVMTQCDRLACSPSTFSWWAGWLGQRQGRIVLAPREGPFRPGAPFVNRDFWPSDWCLLPGLRPLIDHFQLVRLYRHGHSALKLSARVMRLLSPRHPKH